MPLKIFFLYFQLLALDDVLPCGDRKASTNTPFIGLIMHPALKKWFQHVRMYVCMYVCMY